jgi:hypothetical protein
MPGTPSRAVLHKDLPGFRSLEDVDDVKHVSWSDMVWDDTHIYISRIPETFTNGMSVI